MCRAVVFGQRPAMRVERGGQRGVCTNMVESSSGYSEPTKREASIWAGPKWSLRV
jgi:hypothetical protein